MSRKKNTQSVDEDLKVELGDIRGQMMDLQKQMATLLANQTKNKTELLDKITQLEKKNLEQSEKIWSLEAHIDDLEQYSRADNVIITGFDPRHQTYARVVGNRDQAEENEDAPSAEQDSLEDKIVSFLNTKEMDISKSEISICHTLGKDKGGIKNLVIRFNNRKSKIKLLKQGRKLKGSKVYVNEHLTEKNGKLAKIGRILRKEELIQSTWTRNGKVFVKCNKIGDQEKIIKVQELVDFQNCNIVANSLDKVLKTIR
jgi:hypothetical protein